MKTRVSPRRIFEGDDLARGLGRILERLDRRDRLPVRKNAVRSQERLARLTEVKAGRGGIGDAPSRYRLRKAPMIDVETAYLALVLGAFGLFAVVLAFYSSR
jgi:hypothetical protein